GFAWIDFFISVVHEFLVGIGVDFLEVNRRKTLIFVVVSLLQVPINSKSHIRCCCCFFIVGETDINQEDIVLIAVSFDFGNTLKSIGIFFIGLNAIRKCYIGLV